jgi:hypothetical protein
MELPIVVSREKPIFHALQFDEFVILFFKKEILKKNSHGLIIMGDRMREQNQTMREETKKFFVEVAEKFKD